MVMSNFVLIMSFWGFFLENILIGYKSVIFNLLERKKMVIWLYFFWYFYFWENINVVNILKIKLFDLLNFSLGVF